MTKNDRKEFLKLCTLMSQAFDKPMSEALIDIYFDSLKDFDIEQIDSAVKQSIASKKFMPKVAELRELIEGSREDKAELAWRTFLDLVKFEGAYPSLQVYDGPMGYAIDCMGGWQTACTKLGAASPEMVANLEKNFKASYKLGQMRAEEPRYLIGEVEANNRNLGAWKEPTVAQPVCLLWPGKIQKATMPLEVATGRLTAEARLALQQGGEATHKYLPAPPRKLRLLNLKPAPEEAEMASPEQLAQLKASISALVPKGWR